MLIRAFMWFAGLSWAAFGVWCFATPQALAMASIVSTGATGDTELRAIYGGMQIAFGALIVGGALCAAWRRGVLITMSFLLGGTFFGRVIGAVLAGEASSYIVYALAFEGLFLAATLACLKATTPSTAS